MFAGAGGAGGRGGAIFNSGGLTVVASTLSGNMAGAGGLSGVSIGGFPATTGAGGAGGAVFNSGTLTVVDSTFAQNEAGAGNTGGSDFTTLAQAGSSGGGGGAIANLGTLELSGSTLRENVAGKGGMGGFATIISGPGGIGGSGGAVFSEGVAGITNSTFVGNAAGAGGAAGSGATIPSTGGSGGGGGAIAAVGSIKIAASTLTDNAVGLGGPGGMGGPTGSAGVGGGVFGSPTVLASVVAANDGSGGGSECAGVVVDGGGNLAFPEAGGCTGFTVADPKLDPAGLAANGGPTQTVALLPGSAALALVPAASCLAAGGEPLTVDQRGVARPTGACDAGAYEVERPAPPPREQQLSASPARKAPDTTLSKKPGKRVATRKKRAHVVIEFRSDQAAAGFECSLDKGRFAPCKSPQGYRLKPGRHTIAVRAVLAGLVDPTPAEASFKVVKLKKKHKRHHR